MHFLTRCLLPLALAASAAAEEVTVDATRRDDGLEVTCRAILEAPVELIWQTLTDYNRLAEFIPGMRSSRVLERRGATVVVEQAGEASFLFFSVPIDVTIASTERPPLAIEARLLKGNLRRMEGVYRIEPQAQGRALLRWDGYIEPGSATPRLFGEVLMRAVIEEQFRGMVREIERRDELRRSQPRSPGT